MSSSSALFFPPSRGAPSIDSGVDIVSAGSRRAADDLAAAAESEFAFLESKPSLLDERVARGKAGNGKGRRHAGEAVLRRKLANQAFLVKVGGGGTGGFGGGVKELGGGKSAGGSGGHGHRRRGQRVLSELVADQFAPSVPYSLNRKSRWAQEGVDWLRELAGGWTGAGGPKLRLSVAEADYSLAGTESIRALHRLEMATPINDQKVGKTLMPESRWAKSGRGAMLADLARFEEEKAAGETEERENEVPPTKEMLFQLTRPNPVSRLFAGKFFKRKQFLRSNKRSGGIELASGGCLPSSNRPPMMMESEPEEENEFLAQYRPRRETYSLADFVKDSSNVAAPISQSTHPRSSPLIIRRRQNGANNKSHKSMGAASLDEQQLNSFAIIPQLECVPLPDSPIDFRPIEESTLIHSNQQQCPRQQQQCCPPALLELLRQRLNAAGNGFFRQFPLALAISGTAQIGALASGKKIGAEDWHAQWLGENLLAMDLSWTMAKEPEEQTLVLVLSPGELLVNSLIPLNEQKVIQALEGTDDDLEHKIRGLIDAVRADFAEFELSRQHQRTAPGGHQHLGAMFHSPRMSLALQPLCIQAILAQQRAEFRHEEEQQRQQFVGAEELLGGGDKFFAEQFDVDGEEEFEVIDMDELLLGNVPETKLPNEIAEIGDGQLQISCADCAKFSNNGPMPLASVPGCGHQCCRECLGTSVQQQQQQHGIGASIGDGNDDALVNANAINLHCPICPAQLSLELLAWLIPLPTANALILLREAGHAIHGGHQLAQCPCCLGILDAGGNNHGGGTEHKMMVEFGQISCNCCALHWCPKCEGAPHWPMDCAQNGEWQRRTRPNNADNQKVAQQQQINGQFAEVCTESRARRLDARLGWQLGKHMRRLGDSRTERRFILARKTALHLLEFGTAWLYLNRHPRPPAWNQLKSLLWAIRERVECLDNELLFSGSLTDAETIKTKLADLEQLGEKGLAKFSAVLAKEEENNGQHQ